MTILVDIDSTITNFAEALLRTLNRLYNTNYTYRNITSYDWFDKTFPKPWLPTEHDYFWDEVKINPDAVMALEFWIKQGHDVYLCTASHFNDMLNYKIQKTLKPFNPSLINERNVIIAQNKSLIRGDMMIDDCIDNLYSFDGVGVCYSQPWNQNFPGTFRYNEWSKIDSVVQVYSINLWHK